MNAVAEPLADSHQRLLEAATAAFAEEGYKVSIDRIASRAQVARQTLYNHFGSKDALFAEVVRQAIASILVALDGTGPLRDRLLAFGTVYRKKLLSAEGLALFRTMTCEAPRFPELAAQFYREGPQTTRRRLAEILRQAMDAGELADGDALFAAEMLTAMLVYSDRLRGLLDTPPRIPDVPRVTRVVDTFLRAFAPDRNTP